AGKIIVDEEQRKFDDDPTHYYFLVGILHSVIEGVRGISLTYGQTIINGRFIRTGKIESTDGQVYFGLDDNELVIKKESYASEVAGIWLGKDDDKYKLNIGDATKYLKWDGAALTIKGLVGDITLDSNGFIRTDGKTSYESTFAGFWLGWSAGYKLNIGDAAHYLKWTGSKLQVKGLASLDALSAINANIGNITAGNIRGTRFQVGGGTNEDIYFEDSGLRLYDVGGQCISLTKIDYSNLDIGISSNSVAISTLDESIKRQVPAL
ncbi:unnamed protein product, partial [marine sediment metagenome]